MKSFFKTATFLCAMFVLFVTQTQIAVGKSRTDEQIIQISDYTVEQVVEQKLGEGSYVYEKLSSFSDPNRFILVEGNNCYLIYDNELKDFYEFSTESNSVYYGLNKSFLKIYHSPTFYFYKYENKVYDLYFGKEIDREEVIKFTSSEKALIQSHLQSKINYLNNSLKSSYLIRESKNSKFINGSYYFENLDNIGININGSCSYVALGMVMSYYDTFKNDNVIDEEYDECVMQSFVNLSEINIHSYSFSPGIKESFHQYLIDYGFNRGYNCSGLKYCIMFDNMVKLLNDQLSPKNIEFTPFIKNNTYDAINFCKNAIDSDNPVIIWISGTDEEIDIRNLSHEVVAYGYDDEGIYTHFGWKNALNRRKVCISNYTIKQAMYINLEAEHFFSNNYKWRVEGVEGTICPCGKMTCTHGEFSYVKYNENIHKYGCSKCNDFIDSPHNFYVSNGFKICYDCGQKVHINHTFTYTPILLGRFHWANCDCGYSKKETCIGMSMVGQTPVCIKCGAIMKGDIFKLKDSEQNFNKE